MAKKTKKAAPQSRETAGIKSFLDMIAPSVVKFEPDHFICGNTFRCVWALREYPTQTDEQASPSEYPTAGIWVGFEPLCGDIGIRRKKSRRKPLALYCAIGPYGSPQCGLPRRFSPL